MFNDETRIRFADRAIVGSVGNSSSPFRYLRRRVVRMAVLLGMLLCFECNINAL